jgi:HD-GYP domain-containing protein (c-di-GMP phosphodiesterase class II)
MVILNLFFLPVVLAGFFLGRYRAGILALFCVLCASVATILRLNDVTMGASPLVIAMAVAVWGAVLGLAALLVGTLSDDRTSKLKELHEAYVGVVQVLSHYLQSANPGLRAQSTRVAELSQDLAAEMNLSPRQIDDIRVASLLYDMGNIEITTRVIRKAVDNFEDRMPETNQHTFHGMDLMLSLGSVLRGAIPLLLNQEQSASERQLVGESGAPVEIPIGARIIMAARDYHNLSLQQPDGSHLTSAEIVSEMRQNRNGNYDSQVLNSLERAILRKPERTTEESLFEELELLQGSSFDA